MSSSAWSIARMPSRTTSWSSTSITRRGGCFSEVIGRDGSGFGGTEISRVLVRGFVGRQGCRDTIEEVLERCFGDAVQDDPVDRPAHRLQGWGVAGAHRELRSILPQWGDLEVGIQRRGE